MGLINESVLDIERKVKYARIVMRVLKECHLVKDFIDYTTTDNYIDFAKSYKRRHAKSVYTEVWYDRDMCGNILGACNFDYYLEQKYGRTFSRQYHPYHLVLCYLALFDEEEYIRYKYREDGKWLKPNEYIENALLGKNYDQGKLDANIVRNWIKQKEIFHGNKD